MSEKRPWYKTARRWCQCNLIEIDGRDCDIGFWTDFWRENHIQGTIVNAGGTVAYFPSENPYQYRAKYLGQRDLLGEFVAAARRQGLAVMARMDINQAVQALYNAHPDWFARKPDGTPHTMGERYLTCINSGYYTQHIPDVMREIYQRYAPDAFGDNSWTGAGGLICHCDTCKGMFHQYSGGMDLPRNVDYEDRAYRPWLQWSIERRTHVWNYFNKVTQGIGGEDCLWMGMLNADFYPPDGVARLYDYAKLSGTGKAQMLDSQAREEYSGFDQNSVNGLAMHQVFGEDALIIESNACYHFGKYFMRRTANAPEETRSWMRTGISAGLAPSPHFIGSKQDDTRMFETPTPVMRWQRENEPYLFDRHLVADVALAWSANNYFFHGKQQPGATVKYPFIGMVAALKRHRVAYFPVNCGHIARDGGKIKLLILPDVAAMADDEQQAVVDYIKAGGSVLCTGGTGMLDALGYPRSQNAIDDVLGIRRAEQDTHALNMQSGLSFKNLGGSPLHNYLRIAASRHPIFDGFEGTDIIEAHGQHYRLQSGKLAPVAHMVPEFPVYPPEFSYMEDECRVSGEPAILAGETGYGGRAVYFAVDIDRRYADSRFPDMGRLLANAVLWARGEGLPFTVQGPGELDCKLYRQPNRLVLHILNHTGLNAWPGSVEQYCPMGPLEVSIRVDDAAPKAVLCRVNQGRLPFTSAGGELKFSINSVLDHELVVVELE